MQVCDTSSAVTPDLVTHFPFLLIGAEHLHLRPNQSALPRQICTLLLEQLLEGQLKVSIVNKNTTRHAEVNPSVSGDCKYTCLLQLTSFYVLCITDNLFVVHFLLLAIGSVLRLSCIALSCWNYNFPEVVLSSIKIYANLNWNQSSNCMNWSNFTRWSDTNTK